MKSPNQPSSRLAVKATFIAMLTLLPCVTTGCDSAEGSTYLKIVEMILDGYKSYLKSSAPPSKDKADAGKAGKGDPGTKGDKGSAPGGGSTPKADPAGVPAVDHSAHAGHAGSGSSTDLGPDASAPDGKRAPDETTGTLLP